MLTLIHSPHTRAATTLWLLEEAGQPYDIRKVTIRRSDGSGAADPNNPHPHGKVPALIHDGVVITEQAAITLYVADAFPESGLGPKIGERGRGPFLTWLAYYAGVFEPAFVSKFMKVEPPRGTAGWVKSEEVMEHLLAVLSQTPFLLGEAFSAVDVPYASTFTLFKGSPLLPADPIIDAYIDRCTARPAWVRAKERDGA